MTRGVKPSKLAQVSDIDDEASDLRNPSDDSDVDTTPHNEERNWLLLNCKREEAERLLANQRDGTFLIRKSSTQQYALSITCNGIVNHCIIMETNRGLGFAEPYNIYDSLKLLVLHYSENSLEIHNDSLNTTLKYPILANLTH